MNGLVLEESVNTSLDDGEKCDSLGAGVGGGGGLCDQEGLMIVGGNGHTSNQTSDSDSPGMAMGGGGRGYEQAGLAENCLNVEGSDGKSTNQTCDSPGMANPWVVGRGGMSGQGWLKTENWGSDGQSTNQTQSRGAGG
jgi:hypothetical protein